MALVAAGVYFSSQEMSRLSEGDVEDVARSAAPAVVDTTALPDAPLPTAPENAQAIEESEPQSVADADAQAARAPRIDEVRVETTGGLVIAGRAEPGTRVDVLVDDEIVATVDADPSGSFAALGTLSANDNARRLTLRATSDDVATVSEDEIILAPVPAPQTTKAPEPAPQVAAQDVAEAPEDEAQDVVQADEERASGLETAASDAVSVSDADMAPDQPVEQVAETDEVAEDETQIAVLRSDDQGVTLVTPQAPPDTVVLDTIGYNDAGDLQLSGRAASTSVEIRAYLNNRAIAQLPVDSEGNWRGEVPEIDTGIYTLRVDAIDADGTVVSRMETPFKREEPSVLAAASAGSDLPVRAVTVQAGDTLWAIARDRYGEGLLYLQVYDANRGSIVDPDLIYPGQVFDLPAE